MTSITDREAWQTGKPISRPTTSRKEIVWIALVAIAVVVILGAAAYYFPVSPELTFAGP
jgi:flagellar basal body-associated protein FliL